MFEWGCMWGRPLEVSRVVWKHWFRGARVILPSTNRPSCGTDYLRDETAEVVKDEAKVCARDQAVHNVAGL